MTSSSSTGSDVTTKSASTPSKIVTGRSAVIAVAVVLIAAFMDLLDATIVSVAGSSYLRKLRSQ